MNTRRRLALHWTAYLLLTAVLAKAGHDLLFSIFMIYDDEGYVLLSLRNAFTAGPLYDQVYTQYGPFFYLWHKALAALGGWEWSNTAGRWITLVYWLGISGLCADLVRRVSRSSLAGLIILAVTFGELWTMTNEPMHPGGMVAFTVALAAWIGVRRDPAEHPWSAAAVASLGVALFFTKINTGLFLLATLWGWLALASRGTRIGRPLALLTGGLFALGPYVIMNGLLAEAWVSTFAVVAAVTLLTTYVVAWPVVPIAPNPLRSWRTATIAGLGLTVAIVGLTLAFGTSLSGLLHGVVLGPLQHPGAYSFHFNWRPGTLGLTAIVLLLTAATLRRPDHPVLASVIHTLRGLLTLATVGAIFQVLPISVPALGLSYGLSLAAVLAYPLIRDRAATARLWLAMLLAWQALHAYPIAVSQLNWGTFLWIPLLVLGLHESLRCIPAAKQRRFATITATAVGLIAAGHFTATFARTGALNRRNGDRLDLPGAADLVLPSQLVTPLRVMALNASHYVSPLFTFTGAYSFNLWTGLPTPTLANATHWFSLLTPAQQEAIMAQLDASPNAGVVVQLDTVRFLLKEGRDISSPLTDYLAAHFTPVLEIDGYALWLKKGRAVELLDVAHWRGPGHLQFALPDALPPLGAAELWIYNGDTRQLVQRIAASNFTLNPTPSGDCTSYEWQTSTTVPFVDGLLLLRDANDRIVQTVRILP